MRIRQDWWKWSRKYCSWVRSEAAQLSYNLTRTIIRRLLAREDKGAWRTGWLAARESATGGAGPTSLIGWESMTEPHFPTPAAHTSE